MLKAVLTEPQIELLPVLKLFSKNFGLVGGTAIALQLGHRQSIDFDLFSNQQFTKAQIRSQLNKAGQPISQVFIDNKDEYTIMVNDVKLTFLYYPFKIKFSKKLGHIIAMPDLLTLAAMKAYALGRRTKWKDYIDLYFIMKRKHSLSAVSKKARQLFKGEFNEKIFKSQLAYFKDVDYSEEIVWVKNKQTAVNVIKQGLKQISLS
ncbi:MAG: nucleotidyl transferase AbiEii/AbiGii toxin family protein [bacterium]